jgi:hypothetical protein
MGEIHMTNREEELKRVAELIRKIAFYEVHQAVGKGAVTLEMANNDIFMRGVIFGITTTQYRYKQMDDMEGVVAKVIGDLLAEEKDFIQKN